MEEYEFKEQFQKIERVMRRILYLVMVTLFSYTLTITLIDKYFPLSLQYLGSIRSNFDVVIALFGISNVLLLPFFICSF